MFRRIVTRFESLSRTTRALFWASLAGLLFSLLNTELRVLAKQMHPFQAQFLRYACGLLVLLPFVLRTGFKAYKTLSLSGQCWRGAVHTLGLTLWFLALPHLALADTTAIGFTGPIFIMIGAVFFLKEKLTATRWIAAGIGFLGMLIVVGPQLAGSGGWWTLVMFAASPVFAASFLITKALTKRDSPSVIVVWQSITVSAFTFPMAAWVWTDISVYQGLAFLVAGILGSAGHWSLTNAYRIADISASQSAKFLDLVWASALGFLVFGDTPTFTTIIGGIVICSAAVWIARRESRQITSS
jgi:drug/metabolite transporter (DMT)-like permease